MDNYAVIFDLDGTLWEVVDANYDSLCEVIKKHNLKEVSKERLCANYGNNKEQSAKFLFPDVPLEDAYDYLDEIDKITIRNVENNGAYIYPGLEETLFNLSEKYDLYIVSNTPTKKYIEAFLTSSKLFKYFKDYYAASEINLSKGLTIRKLIEDYSIDKAIYVGDTLNDYKAAEEANVPFIQCLYGFSDSLNTKYNISDVTELKEEVEKVFEELQWK